jgi:hypothetical protein
MLYRPHRATLQEAMEEVTEVSSIEDIAKFETNDFYHIDAKDITVEYYCYDERIDWKTYIVCNKGNAIGFTNGPL